MSTMTVMHPIKGHATMTWDKTDKKSTAEVRAAFDELIANGMTGIVTTPEGDVATRKFADVVEAEEVTIIPALEGG